MTFREVLAALWRRKWIIVGVVALAVIVGVVYLARLAPDYKAAMTFRISPTMSQGVSSGVLTGVPVDVDPSMITNSTIVDTVATELGVPPSALGGAVSAEVGQAGIGTATTLTVTITAHAATSQEAQTRAKAFGTAYAAYLDQVTATTLKTLQTRKAGAEKDAATYSQELSQHPGDPVAQANLGDAVSTISTLNASIQTLQTAGPAATVTAPAQPGVSTTSPPGIVIPLALVCGLIAGAGIALVRDQFDDRLRSVDDLARASEAPALVAIPFDRRVAQNHVRFPGAERSQTPLSESIRSLRTNIQVMLPDGGGTVVITSVEPTDGKTFLSANLAVSWARAGRRVILVGGDMRRPEFERYFPDSLGGPGLSGVLAEARESDIPPHQDQIERALQPTAYRRLFLLPPGEQADDPADLLAGAALVPVMRGLAAHADIVVVDTPPVALADASMLGALADGTVLVTRVGRTRRTLILEAVDALTANGVKLIGTVANRARRDRLPRSYRSYYTHDGGAAELATDAAASPQVIRREDPRRGDEASAFRIDRSASERADGLDDTA